MAKNQVAAATNDEEDIGNINLKDLAAAGFEEVDPLQGLDIVFNAGQDGFDKGVTKFGLYKGTKLCTTTKDKKPLWKDHPTKPGKVCRVIHLFQTARLNGELLDKSFGIWSAGMLTATLDRVMVNQLIAVTYEGLAEKGLRQNDDGTEQAPPHMFTISAPKGAKIRMEEADPREGEIRSA